MKKIFSILAALFVFAGAFAQTKPSTGLTDKDVKNFAKNYATIEKQLEKLGVNADASDFSKLMEIAEAEAILEKNGISGPNRCQKVAMIGICVGIVGGEENIDAQTREMMKAYGIADPLAALRAQSNEQDYKIVKNNYPALVKALKLDE